jgi:hypothetical protein
VSDFFKAVPEDKLPILDIDFTTYDEKVVYLNPGWDKDQVDYWTGYYSNLPFHKQLICDAFTTMKIASLFGTVNATTRQQIVSGAHHDSITGVSKKAVH